MALDVAGQRGGGAAGDVPGDPARAAVRPRVLCAAGSTGRSFCAKSIRSARRPSTHFWKSSSEVYAEYTPEFAERESGAPAKVIVEVAREIGRAGSALATHVWRNAAAGNLGGWQVARALELLVVLMGAVDAPGGTAPNSANKFVPAPPMMPPPAKVWNEMTWPREFPLAFFEMSFLLPHFLKEGHGKIGHLFHPRL